ncbi:hypothetical protein DRN93_02345 [archaeon]|nr:MAG: hypothetical protein DRN93_02345 [archaeon]
MSGNGNIVPVPPSRPVTPVEPSYEYYCPHWCRDCLPYIVAGIAGILAVLFLGYILWRKRSE